MHLKKALEIVKWYFYKPDVLPDTQPHAHNLTNNFCKKPELASGPNNSGSDDDDDQMSIRKVSC